MCFSWPMVLIAVAISRPIPRADKTTSFQLLVFSAWFMGGRCSTRRGGPRAAWRYGSAVSMGRFCGCAFGVCASGSVCCCASVVLCVVGGFAWCSRRVLASDRVLSPLSTVAVAVLLAKMGRTVSNAEDCTISWKACIDSDG